MLHQDEGTDQDRRILSGTAHRRIEREDELSDKIDMELFHLGKGSREFLVGGETKRVRIRQRNAIELDEGLEFKVRRHMLQHGNPPCPYYRGRAERAAAGVEKSSVF